MLTVSISLTEENEEEIPNYTNQRVEELEIQWDHKYRIKNLSSVWE